MADPTGNTPRITESTLHEVWKSVLPAERQLTTLDGRLVGILSPGRYNSDEGPDFIDAKIMIGEQKYAGDVEIHVDAASWSAHGHDRDPHYNRTILHVVFHAVQKDEECKTESGRALPILVLEGQIQTVKRTDLGRRTGSEPAIRCHQLNINVDEQIIIHWLEQLGWEKIELRIQLFEERLKQLIDESEMMVSESTEMPYEEVPVRKYRRQEFLPRDLWEQLLYEGIMEAMGYSKNRNPFVLLSRSVRLSSLRRFGLADPQTMMAILFGAAGLLPSVRSVAEDESRLYLHSLRSRWRELSQQFNGAHLHPGEWKFFRTRPVNFPTARLAAFVFLLPRFFRENSLPEMIGFILSDSPAAARKKLRALFAIQPDHFWQTHFRFGEAATSSGVTFGRSRRDDIIFNSVLPVLLLYARLFNSNDLREAVRRIAADYPALQKNPVTEKIRKELAHDTRFDSAILQQGAIRLYGHFCQTGECGECTIGRAIGLRTIRPDSGEAGGDLVAEPRSMRRSRRG